MVTHMLTTLLHYHRSVHNVFTSAFELQTQYSAAHSGVPRALQNKHIKNWAHPFTLQ